MQPYQVHLSEEDQRAFAEIDYYWDEVALEEQRAGEQAQERDEDELLKEQCLK